MGAYLEHSLEIQGRLLNMAVGPDHGPPLLLLHGVTRRWQDFQPILPVLGARYQIHALDFRGHGRSDWATGRYRVVDYVADVVEVIESHIDEPPIVLGHSLGAMVAAAVAEQLPQKVRAVVLEDPPFDTMGRGIESTSYADLFRGMLQIARQLGPKKSRGLDEEVRDAAAVQRVSRALAEITLATSGKPRTKLGDGRDATALRFSAWCLLALDPAVLEGIIDGNWLEGYDRDAVFAGMQIPTLLLQADQQAGGALSDEQGQAMERAMADCTRIVLPGTGHLIHWMHTDVLLRHVLSFLGSLEVERRR